MSLFDSLQAFGTPKRFVQLALRLRRDVSAPFLLVDKDEGDGTLALIGLCRQRDNAFAAVVSMAPGALPQDILELSEEVIAGWESTLALALECEPRRIQWAAVNFDGAGFYAVEVSGSRTWVRVADIAPSQDNEGSWAGLQSLVPEYARYAKLAAGALRSAATAASITSRTPYHER